MATCKPLWLFCALMLSACASPAPTTTAVYRIQRVTSDEAFIRGAAAGHEAEVTLSQVAFTHCRSARCRAFAMQAVEDHLASLRRVKRVASHLGVTLDPEACKELQPLADAIAKLPGASFDRAYLAAMVQDHTSDVQVYRQTAASGQSAEVKALAAELLPTIEEHLRLAQEAQRAL